jgi:hypothetical protein
MGDIVLTEHQQLCRTAHQQVAMLRDLYDHLLLDEDSGLELEIPGFSARDRMGELEHDSEMLAAKLDALELLPAPPDPEWEGVLEALAKLKRALTGQGDSGVLDRFVQEEGELLRLTEGLAQHDRDPALAESIAKTRAALGRLQSATPPAG